MRLWALGAVVLLCSGCRGMRHCVSDFSCGQGLRSACHDMTPVNTHLAAANAGYCDTNWTTISSTGAASIYFEPLHEGFEGDFEHRFDGEFEELPVPPANDETAEVAETEVSQLFAGFVHSAEAEVVSHGSPPAEQLGTAPRVLGQDGIEQVVFEDILPEPAIDQRYPRKVLVDDRFVSDSNTPQDPLRGEVREVELVPAVVEDQTEAGIESSD